MKTTPLTSWHQAHGAKMTEFGGYLMPLEYSSIVREHTLVREQVGMFDVCHMGEFRVSGPGAAAFLDYLVTHWPSRLAPGRGLYTPMCRPDGGTVDDLVIFRLDPESFWLVVNAGQADVDWAWVNDQAQNWPGVVVVNQSENTGLIAVQGPRAMEVLQPLTDRALEPLTSYQFFDRVTVAGRQALVSRTGYTGEDGFEIFVEAQDVAPVWEALASQGVPPIGLGARDTLRLEARMPLYGHELSPEISPVTAGLSSFIRWEKGDFVGRAALAQEKEAGRPERIVGLVVQGGIARAGYPVQETPEGPAVGMVTSGTWGPTVRQAIALAKVPARLADIGTSLWVVIRNRAVAAEVVRTPFYRRPKPKNSVMEGQSC